MTVPPKMSIQDIIAQAVQTTSAQMMTDFTNRQTQRDGERDDQLDKKLVDLEKRMEKKMERKIIN